MPRKASDAGKRASTGMEPEKTQHKVSCPGQVLSSDELLLMPAQKTERSHAENQERAYIAASRRADRSIEARVQSARMASEIHKKRTGKGFRITEEIVMKEEMYEEEEEAFPRSLRLLGPGMETSSHELNVRMEAYLTNRMAMSAMVATNNDSWRQNAINKQFDQAFPNANSQAQQMHRNMPSQADGISQRPSQPTQNSPMSYASPPFQSHNSQSSMTFESQSPLSPLPQSSPTPTFNDNTPNFSPTFGTALPQFQPTGQSSFTQELPPDARMLMMGMEGMDDYNYQSFDADPMWTDGPNVEDGLSKGQFLDMNSSSQPSMGQEINWDSWVNDTNFDGEVDV